MSLDNYNAPEPDKAGDLSGNGDNDNLFGDAYQNILVECVCSGRTAEIAQDQVLNNFLGVKDPEPLREALKMLAVALCARPDDAVTEKLNAQIGAMVVNHLTAAIAKTATRLVMQP